MATIRVEPPKRIGNKGNNDPDANQKDAEHVIVKCRDCSRTIWACECPPTRTIQKTVRYQLCAKCLEKPR